MTRIKFFCEKVVSTNGFVLGHANSLQIYLFFQKRYAKERLSKRCLKESKL